MFQTCQKQASHRTGLIALVFGAALALAPSARAEDNIVINQATGINAAVAATCSGGSVSGPPKVCTLKTINAAGSSVIGQVGIDQTTPGTTNGVQVNAALPAGTNLLGKVGIDQTTPGTTNAVAATPAALFPLNSTPITASATGTTAATTATLAATGGKTTYICGFAIRADATAAATGNATVSNTVTGTLNFTQWTAPLASGVGTVEERFYPCIPANAVNTTIPVASAAPGSGGTVSVSAWGYQQ